MNVEENRLQTFSDWPRDAEVTPERIAKAGFFSTRNGLEVECFSCHAKISNWNYGDQVMEKHRTLSPNCSFVLNPLTTENVPLISPTSTASTSYHQYQESLALRLASFENWPATNIVSPESLARAGFFYLKIADNTKCAFCKGVVRAWVLGDDPDIEHQRHFPNCSFVINIINPRISSRNPNAESDNSNISRTIDQKIFPNINIISNEQTLDELGVQAHKGPKRSSYATVESRLRSYVGWSSDLIQTPEFLAQAGFYYEGVGDQVRCFHCDGGLKHWDPHDDPWTEHARWFPNCSFVRLIKGQEFVTSCALDQGPQLNLNRPTEKISVQTSRRRVTEQEVQEHLSSPEALAALSIGLNIERVKSAIREKLERTGRPYSQPDALVEAALNVQHDEEGYSSSEDMGDSTVRQTVTASLINLLKRNLPTSSNDGVQHGEQVNNVCTNKNTDLPLDKPVSLEEENRLLKEARLCKICMDGEVSIVFLPCGHLTTCVNCAPNLEDCPVCRCAIKATVRTFLS